MSVFAIVIIWSFSFPICSACNPHCGSCDSQASCTSCRDPNKVLIFGDCQNESCAPQYYLDFSTNTCKGEAHPELYSSFTSDAPLLSMFIPHLGKILSSCIQTFSDDSKKSLCMYVFMYSLINLCVKVSSRYLFVKQIFLSTYYVPAIVQVNGNETRGGKLETLRLYLAHLISQCFKMFNICLLKIRKHTIQKLRFF